MGIRVKAELRKINGVRYARFTLLDDVEAESREESLLTAAMRECHIEVGGNVGMFKNLSRAADGTSISRIGGVDIPIDAIKDFTTALNERGFDVS